MSSFKEAFAELLQGTVNAGLKISLSKEQLEYYGVKIPKPKPKSKLVKVKNIRKQVKLDQKDFAFKLGVAPRYVRMWESGERKPTGPSYALLSLLAKKPELVNYL